jgi:hypothetical protein
LAAHLLIGTFGTAIGVDQPGSFWCRATLAASQALDYMSTIQRLLTQLTPEPRSTTENEDFQL